MVFLGIHIKKGLIATLIICACMVIYRYQLAAAFWTGITVLRGIPNYCSAGESLKSIENNINIRGLAERYYSEANLLKSDSGLDLYVLGEEQIWTSRNSLWSIAFENAEQENTIYENSRIRISSGDVVLDVGAHVGLFTKRALREGPSLVVAIEPSPLSVECLRRNLVREVASGRVLVYPKGVWNEEKHLEMSLSEGVSGEDSFVHESQNAKKILLPVTTIDKLARELNLQRVDFIKMDIEGSERQALAGAAETIKRFHPRMAICVYHLPDDPAVIPEIIRGIDSTYRWECGVCVAERYQISPQVYFFY